MTNWTPPYSTYSNKPQGDKRKALELFNHGQAIRKELELDNLNKVPAFFAELQQHYPLTLHARTKAGEVALVQQPGKLDVGKLKGMGVGRADVVKYVRCFCACLTLLLCGGWGGSVHVLWRLWLR